MSQEIKTIAVLGTGCPSCKKLFELTTQAVKELGLLSEVEYVTDIQKIVAMGIMQTPVLAVNNVPVMTGATNDIEKIKTLLVQRDENTCSAEGESSKCGCGGSC
ncbi:MAG: Redox-active disulfide protein 2 [Parcubacteria group bacterium GW2011_GWA2_43_11]|nr:MAG: Redox-active disulfide protein 2 [Parcubacteria group bacterium GW2011_GWC2_42_11]KKS85110.1 MAG: Redox-active disulfide protein 2 [Parcubacteria group bacterium GW2011_GWA2_43_11]